MVKTRLVEFHGDTVDKIDNLFKGLLRINTLSYVCNQHVSISTGLMWNFYIIIYIRATFIRVHSTFISYLLDILKINLGNYFFLL